METYEDILTLNVPTHVETISNFLHQKIVILFSSDQVTIKRGITYYF